MAAVQTGSTSVSLRRSLFVSGWFRLDAKRNSSSDTHSFQTVAAAKRRASGSIDAGSICALTGPVYKDFRGVRIPKGGVDDDLGWFVTRLRVGRNEVDHSIIFDRKSFFSLHSTFLPLHFLPDSLPLSPWSFFQVRCQHRHSVRLDYRPLDLYTTEPAFTPISLPQLQVTSCSKLNRLSTTIDHSTHKTDKLHRNHVPSRPFDVDVARFCVLLDRGERRTGDPKNRRS